MSANPHKKGSFFDRAKEYAIFQYLRLLDGKLKVSSPKNPNEKWVLVVKLDLLGDYVLIRNFLEAIKKSKRYAGHKIVFCCNKGVEELSRHLDADIVDRWIPMQLKPFLKQRDYRKNILEQLMAQSYEAALFPTQSRSFFYDDIIARTVEAKEKIAPVGNGYNQFAWQEKKAKAYYSQLLQTNTPKGFEYIKNKEFFSQLLQEDLAPELPFIDSHKAQSSPTVLLSPGASAEFRRWSTGHFVAFSKALLQAVPNATVLISGAPGEKTLCESIKLPFADDERVKNLCGKLKLSDLCTTLSGCQLVVSNESGTVHLARAVGVLHIYCISNGNHYGRFNPYPESNDGIEVSYFYPKEVHSILEGKHTHLSKEDLYWGSRIGIDSIGPEVLITHLQKESNRVFQTV